MKAARKAPKSEAPDPEASSANGSEPAAETLKKDKSSHSSKKVSAANGKASKTGRPDLEALARGLPAGWRPMYDKASSSVYYGNLSTKVSHRPIFCLQLWALQTGEHPPQERVQA